MTSAGRIAANRRNAQRSTGHPRSSAGKARSAQNARRHGLSRTAACDPARADEIAALACLIAGPDAAAERLALAVAIAAAQIDVVRARRARCELWSAAPGALVAIPQLAAIDRYERRALARRRRAIAVFDAADDPRRRNEPIAERAAEQPDRESSRTNPSVSGRTNPSRSARGAAATQGIAGLPARSPLAGAPKRYRSRQGVHPYRPRASRKRVRSSACRVPCGLRPPRWRSISVGKTVPAML